jgi:iron complex outermembrane receptor protein
MEKLIGIRRLHLAAFLVTGIGSVLIAQSALADELEEIVVTAQKRQERMQDVPISISVLSGDAIVGRSLSDLSSLSTQVVGVQSIGSDQGGSNVDFYIRGIGQNDFLDTTDPGVGVYIDGVFVARTSGGLLDLTDVDRVEVLRGPQGTLFGMNTIGGAISVFTKKPDFLDEGSAFIRAGERDRIDAGVTVNIPIIDQTFAIRINALTKNQEGYGTSLETGERYGGEGKDIFKIAALWLPANGVEVNWSGDYTQVDQTTRFSTVLAINPNTFVTQPQNQWALENGVAPYDQRWVSPSFYKNYATNQIVPPNDHEDIYGTSLGVNWTVAPGLLFRSISAYRESREETGLAFSAAPSAIGDQTVHETDDQLSQEFILSGKSLAEKLDWATGLYYLHEDIFSDVYLPLSFPDNPVGYDTNTTNRGGNTNYAAYGQATYQLTDRWAVVLGARESYEYKVDTLTVFANKFDAYLLPATVLEHSWDSFTYRAGLQYKIAPDVLAYTSIATGFKSGGFNGRAQSDVFIAFGPERATTTEVGLKSELLDRRIRLNLAAYVTNYDDIQTTLNVTDPVTGLVTNVIANPADARIKGLELDSSYLLTNYFRVDLGATSTSAHYTHILNGAQVTLSDHLPEVPVWSANVGAQLDLPAPTALATDGIVTVRLDESHKASYYDGAPNTPYNFEPHLDVVNGRLSYGPRDGKWSVAAYARNLLNHQYLLFHEDLYAFVYSIGTPAPPREVGGEIHYRW